MADRSGEDVTGAGRGESPPRARAERPARLSVNLGSGPAEALRELMASKGISATEAIRRAISVWRFIEDEQGRGNRIAVIETAQGKQNVREVLFRME
ncbi:CopG family transcriptional regulator [Cryptosporangium sp. NPDC048952]|uniref:CopG family transcriptional regulator n=1 Tax=Cryptosporangium sp. NPDC048952 TaxID=3363961 RepID=UPI003723E28C